MRTRVVHFQREHYDFAISRPSIWGNPFVLKREADRESVMAQYADWVIRQPDLLARVGQLEGKALGCYCAPRACHGDVLALLAEGVPADCLYLFISGAARSA